jgi:hypothetical protein
MCFPLPKGVLRQADNLCKVSRRRVTECQYNAADEYHNFFYRKEHTKIDPGGRMFIWCSLLFALGVMAFIDSLFNMGEIFRQVNSVLFMLISLGLLIRTTTKMKTKKKEEYQKTIKALEQQVSVLKHGEKTLAEF